MIFFIVVGTFAITCSQGFGCQEGSWNAMRTVIAAGTVECIFEIYGVIKIYISKNKEK